VRGGRDDKEEHGVCCVVKPKTAATVAHDAAAARGLEVDPTATFLLQYAQKRRQRLARNAVRATRQKKEEEKLYVLTRC
jgi:hypothetical protein